MNDDAKYICERLTQAPDDYTSIGRWGWALLIGFLTQILIETAKAHGVLFNSLSCEPGSGPGNDLAQSFLLIIAIAAVAYFWFLRQARRKVVTARSAVFDLNADPVLAPGVAFAKSSAPTDRELANAMILRLAIFGVLIVVWMMVFEPKLSTLWCMLRGVPDATTTL